MRTTLTSKGQLTVPKSIRERLEIKAGDKLEFFIHDNGMVELVPITSSITKLKGMVPKPEKPVSLADMEKAICEGASDRD